ncbi:MAG: hypothetical protein IR158_01270 [Cellulomonas sp.]|jgi:hypothetical protein|uniref:hypothetical protein n=1 Tax=Cellulomonas sp. TaxID=40001 RepID=UPI0019FEB509|nr:hypothetical protein [Cellulomonas sp.]MBF0686384.1 hypothetical protein [Cellulomonas sp.]
MSTDRAQPAPRTAMVVVVRAWSQHGTIAARLVLDPEGGPRRTRSVVVGSLDDLCAALARELTAALDPGAPEGTAEHGP